MGKKLKVGDYVRCSNFKGYWKIREIGERVIYMEMFFTEDFKHPKVRVPCRLFNEEYAEVIDHGWIEKQIEDAHKNYENLWAAIEDEEYAQRNN